MDPELEEESHVPTGLALSHVGITVSDLDAALEWYCRVFGFEVSIPPAESSTRTADAAMMREMLGPQFGQIRYAIMSTGSGVFLEFFESVDPPTELVSERATFWRTGPWHIAVTDPDIEALASSIEANGGRVLSAVRPLVDGTNFRICMCVDPFGVTIEVYSHPIEEILAAMAA